MVECTFSNGKAEPGEVGPCALASLMDIIAGQAWF
jgi:hypothetical protein